MDSAIAAVLERLEQRIAWEEQERRRISREEFERRREEFMLALGRESGLFLNLLIKAAGCRRILEVGTSVGYSALWLAEAARATGGQVTTLDRATMKQEQARQNLAEAGLAAQVELIAGNALESLAHLPGPWDFVLLDYPRDLYIPTLEALRPKLAEGALVAADNMLWPEASVAAARQYQAHVRALPAVQSVLVPIGNGMELSRVAHLS